MAIINSCQNEKAGLLDLFLPYLQAPLASFMSEDGERLCCCFHSSGFRFSMQQFTFTHFLPSYQMSIAVTGIFMITSGLASSCAGAKARTNQAAYFAQTAAQNWSRLVRNAII